jgi:AcrR family transcriptional regulator
VADTDNQRTHILEAVAAIVAERGVRGVTLADVLEGAGVSRRVFRDLFDDLDAAVLSAFDLGIERAREQIVPAYSPSVRWRDGIRPALAELLRFLDAEPALARLCVVQSLSGGPLLLRRRAGVQTLLVEIVDRGRGEPAAGRAEPPGIVAEGVVGAVTAVVQARLFDQDADPAGEHSAIELFGSLMSLIVLPYLGSSAARRELSRPIPPLRAAGSPGALRGPGAALGHGVRLTYRTCRVLAAIAHYPGASNREVAEHAEIADQGQISKLLSRLQYVGLIANINGSATRGGSNAWRLTELGEGIAVEAAERVAQGAPEGSSGAVSRRDARTSR